MWLPILLIVATLAVFAAPDGFVRALMNRCATRDAGSTVLAASQCH
jgi:hypothetical protein